MPRRPTARRYAQAIFDLALEYETIDQWGGDLDRIAEALDDEDFAALLEAPQVPERVKHQGIETVLGSLGLYARNFVSVLVEHGQPRLASRIRDEFRAMVDEHLGVARAEVVTAVALEEDQRGRVEASLSDIVGARVVASERVDPSIIGGVVARVGDRLIDGSVRNRLEALRHRLARPPAEARAAGDESS